MVGSILTNFSDMIIDKMEMKQWNALIEKTAPPSKGVYTNGNQYTSFHKVSPAYISTVTSLREFLLVIVGVIHLKVKRLRPNAYLPKLEYEKAGNNSLNMYYNSKRKLCHISFGLISGAAKHYKEKITIKQPEGMHHGADRCKLIISFEG